MFNLRNRTRRMAGLRTAAALRWCVWSTSRYGRWPDCG